MSFNAFVNEFNEAPLQTSYSSYLSIDFSTGVECHLEWTFQNQNTEFPFATVIETINNDDGDMLFFPDATVTSVGTTTTIINTGPDTLNVVNFSGGSIEPLVLTGQQWQFTLTDNSTQAGTWLGIQLGALTSDVSAPSLIDNTTDGNPSGAHGNQGGLLALPFPGSQQFLGMNITVNKIANGASAYTQYSGDRGSALVWLSGSGTYTCQPASEYTNGYNFIIINQGTGILTIAPSPETGNTINGTSTVFTLNPTQSSLFVSDGDLTIYSYGTSASTSNKTTILPVDLDNATGSPLSLNITEIQAQYTILQFINGTGSNVYINYPQLPGNYIAYNSSSNTTVVLQIIGNTDPLYAYGLLPNDTTTLITNGSNTNLLMSPNTIYNSLVTLQSADAATPALSFAQDLSSGIYLPDGGDYDGLPTVVYSASPSMSFANRSGTTTCFSALNTVNPVSEDPVPLTSSYFDNSISIYTIMRAYE